MDQNRIDYLSQLPADVFIQEITYLPFQDVVNVCSTNNKLRAYCIDPTYNTRWKALINNTFQHVIYDYDNKLKELWKKLNIEPDTYNYLVYTKLVKLLDPVTQAMIYYRQGDMNSFEQLTKVQKFLAMFLLGNKDKIREYLPDDDDYLPFLSGNKLDPFISMLSGNKLDKDILNKMLMEMAKEGNMNGIKYFEIRDADIHADDDLALINAAVNGYLEVVKYLVEHGANIHGHVDWALRWASRNGYLEVVKYLIEHGADIHAGDDWALIYSSRNGHLNVVKYLISVGADVHAGDDEALRLAIMEGHLDVVKYLESLLN